MHTLVIIAAAVLAGAINSIAGGGTLISFPALLWIGVNPILANATNTVALWPGSFAALVGYRRDIARVRSWLLWLILPSLAGGAVGAVLLLKTPTHTFERLVPWLILGATLLLAAQEGIARRFAVPSTDAASRRWIGLTMVAQFFIGIYGGYFGAGIGILMLATLGLIGMRDLHEMNGLKNLLAICINGVAAIYFALSGAVLWTDAALMAAGSIAGGYLGARMAKRLGRKFVRWAVVVIGLTLTVVFFLEKS